MSWHLFTSRYSRINLSNDKASRLINEHWWIDKSASFSVSFQFHSHSYQAGLHGLQVTWTIDETDALGSVLAENEASVLILHPESRALFLSGSEMAWIMIITAICMLHAACTT